MQKKHVWSHLTPLLSFLLIALFTLTNTASSCKDDDDEIKGESTSSIENTLRAKKWYHSEKEYHTYSYGGSEETNTWTLYFFPSNKGYRHWTYTDKDSSLGTTRDEGWDEFTYSVSGNKVNIRYSNSSEVLMYESNSGYLFNFDETVVYEPLAFSSNDAVYTYINNKKYESLDVEDYVKVEYTNKNYYQHIFVFNSTLSQAFKGQTISYHVDYHFGKEYDNAKLTDSGKTQYTFTLTDSECQLYYESLVILQEKQKRGETLSNADKEFLREMPAVIREMRDDFLRDVEVYVKVGEKKHKLSYSTSYENDDNINNGNNSNGNNSNNNIYAETKTYTVKGVSFKMVYVEKGSFQMGREDGYYFEKPIHEVKLNSFAIGQTEVTQELWEAVMGSNPSNWKGSRLPVEKVSWNDCQTFITKLNQHTGQQFRLPTEAEWEYAARGGNQSKGYTYSGSNNIEEVAWYDDNSGNKTHEVATKAPNELGIYDMSGNVFEWCQDWWGANYYLSSPINNPTGPTSGYQRIARSSFFDSRAWSCRVTNRGSENPTGTFEYIGFRLAL